MFITSLRDKDNTCKALHGLQSNSQLEPMQAEHIDDKGDHFSNASETTDACSAGVKQSQCEQWTAH